jgi:hypothetical protein
MVGRHNILMLKGLAGWKEIISETPEKRYSCIFTFFAHTCLAFQQIMPSDQAMSMIRAFLCKSDGIITCKDRRQCRPEDEQGKPSILCKVLNEKAHSLIDYLISIKESKSKETYLLAG